MGNHLVLLPEVEKDLAEAYGWYEGRQRGLGEEFLARVEACLLSIRQNPQMHALVHESYRRALVRRFPYTVFYEYTDEVVTVYSVFHCSQHPDKWRRRLP